MQLSAKITRHSSPAATGKVRAYPPPLGIITGQSSSIGMAVSALVPSGWLTLSLIASCTVAVLVAALYAWIMPGAATRISLLIFSASARYLSDSPPEIACTGTVIFISPIPFPP